MGRVPEASREVYASEWQAFQNWRAKATPPFSGLTTSKHVHAYLVTRWKEGRWRSSATLWSKCSILRAMAHIVDKQLIKDDADDKNVQAWLKSLGKGQKPKQSATFTRRDVQRYVQEVAQDPLSLPNRLLLLIGCNTGCHSQALYSLEFRHVQETDTGDLRITIDYAQKHDQGACGQSWIIRKNAANTDICASQLFKNYHSIAATAGLLTGPLWHKLYIVDGQIRMRKTRLGEHWVAGLPKLVATHLGIEEAHLYTGHTLRRACAVRNAGAGASKQEMSVPFGWKNSSMASRYTSSSEITRQNAADRTELG